MMFTTKAKQEACKRDIEPKTVCNDGQSGKKLQRQEVSTPETLDTDGKPTRRNNIPLLTGSVQVGLLYDAKSDRPLYGDYLWPPPSNDATTTTTPSDEGEDDSKVKSQSQRKANSKTQTVVADVAHSSMDYIFDENILDRLSLIDVTAELKLSFMGGLIEVGNKLLKTGSFFKVLFNFGEENNTSSKKILHSINMQYFRFLEVQDIYMKKKSSLIVLDK